MAQCVYQTTLNRTRRDRGNVMARRKGGPSAATCRFGWPALSGGHDGKYGAVRLQGRWDYSSL